MEEVMRKVMREVMGEVWGEVNEEVEREVVREVVREVRGEVESEIKKINNLKFYNFCVYGDVWDYGWCSFYDFFTKIGVIKNKKFNEYMKIKDTGIFTMIQLKRFCIVVENPSLIKRDENKKLH